MASKKASSIELVASVGADNQLVLSYRVKNGELSLRPGKGIEDLLQQASGATVLTIEVTDFFQYGSVYDVYGATLADGTQQIASHWESTGNGKRGRFEIRSRGEAGRVQFVVGATPRSPGAPVPTLFKSWSGGSGGFPTEDPDSKIVK